MRQIHGRGLPGTDKSGALVKKRHRQETLYIQLNTSECTACFKCIEACPKNVIGKINILIHKHAVIRNGEECTGCGRCVKVCDAGAISSIIQKKERKYEQE